MTLKSRDGGHALRAIYLTVCQGPSPHCLSYGHCPCSPRICRKHNPNLSITLSIAERCTTPSEKPHFSSKTCERKGNHLEIKQCSGRLVCASLHRDVAVKCSWVCNPELVLTKLQGAPQKGKWLHRFTRPAGERHELLSPPMELQPGTSTY